MASFDNEELKQDFLELLLPVRSGDHKDRIITAHLSELGETVFSVFDAEEWKMVIEISQIVDKSIDDIVKTLGPDDVHQLYIKTEIDPRTNPS